jgi:hypothetical protein
LKQIETYDLEYAYTQLETYLNGLIKASCYNDFNEKLGMFLRCFRGCCSNYDRNINPDCYINYVITLDNFQKHHNNSNNRNYEKYSYKKFSDLINDYSEINIANGIKMDGKSSFIVKNKYVINGNTGNGLHIESGRAVSDKNNNLPKNYRIKTPFPIKYYYNNKIVDLKPPHECKDFYILLSEAIKRIKQFNIGK